MSHTYYYFNDHTFPINVTQGTVEQTPYTFQPDKTLWENHALKQFFSRIDSLANINIADVGAQSGLYSLYAKYLPCANFFAFEPFETTFNLLKDNLALNEINNVFPKNIALADKVGTSILNVCKSHFGLHTLGATPLRFSDIERVPVQTSTLDAEFYDKGIPVHFIKIDTEGGELAILRGGIQTLRAYKPVLQLEWNLTNMRQAGASEEQLSALLHSLDYKQISCENEERLFVCESR